MKKKKQCAIVFGLIKRIFDIQEEMAQAPDRKEELQKDLDQLNGFMNRFMEHQDIDIIDLFEWKERKSMDTIVQH